MANNVGSISLICHYFKDLSADQIKLFTCLQECYIYWNERINLISRKDIQELYLHHVLHSLAIAKVVLFFRSSQILDFGTGGGFPGIPLAIMFPEVHFHLVDSIGKKVKAVEAIVATLGLKNVTLSWERGELLTGSYDFVVGRAVANVALFYHWVKDKIGSKQKNTLPNGILYLTGKPTVALPSMSVYCVENFFKEPFFKNKCLIYLPGIDSREVL